MLMNRVKKNTYLFIFFLAMCAYSAEMFQTIQNDFTKGSKLGQAHFNAGIMSEQWFNEFKINMYRAIGQDKSINEDEKTAQSAEIDEMTYIENGSTFFVINSQIPLLEKDKPIGITITDQLGNEYVKSLKSLRVEMNLHYIYSYVMETKVINLKKMSRKQKPLVMTVLFNEDKKIISSIK